MSRYNFVKKISELIDVKFTSLYQLIDQVNKKIEIVLFRYFIKITYKEYSMGNNCKLIRDCYIMIPMEETLVQLSMKTSVYNCEFVTYRRRDNCILYEVPNKIEVYNYKVENNSKEYHSQSVVNCIFRTRYKKIRIKNISSRYGKNVSNGRTYYFSELMLRP